MALRGRALRVEAYAGKRGAQAHTRSPKPGRVFFALVPVSDGPRALVPTVGRLRRSRARLSFPMLLGHGLHGSNSGREHNHTILRVADHPIEVQLARSTRRALETANGCYADFTRAVWLASTATHPISFLTAIPIRFRSHPSSGLPRNSLCRRSPKSNTGQRRRSFQFVRRWSVHKRTRTAPRDV
jgi:hypothetical protein